jgi:hypothetical protein
MSLLSPRHETFWQCIISEVRIRGCHFERSEKSYHKILFHKGIAARITALLFAVDEHHDDREDDTDDYACGEWKIEGEVLAFVKEVAGKLSEPRYFPSQEEKQTQACDHQTDNNQNLAEAGKISHALPHRIKTVLKHPPIYFPPKSASRGLCSTPDVIFYLFNNKHIFSIDSRIIMEFNCFLL